MQGDDKSRSHRSHLCMTMSHAVRNRGEKEAENATRLCGQEAKLGDAQPLCRLPALIYSGRLGRARGHFLEEPLRAWQPSKRLGGDGDSAGAVKRRRVLSEGGPRALLAGAWHTGCLLHYCIAAGISLDSWQRGNFAAGSWQMR